MQNREVDGSNPFAPATCSPCESFNYATSRRTAFWVQWVQPGLPYSGLINFERNGDGNLALAGLRNSEGQGAPRSEELALRRRKMAVDYFLKIDGIQGESTDAKHEGEISTLSWSWGETQATTPGAGGGAAKVSMQDFRFSKAVDKTSPKLMLVVPALRGSRMQF